MLSFTNCGSVPWRELRNVLLGVHVLATRSVTSSPCLLAVSTFQGMRGVVYANLVLTYVVYTTAAGCPEGQCSDDFTCVFECSCHACPPGTSCGGDGAFCEDKQQYCEAGSFAAAPGSPACSLCPLGQFSTFGATNCSENHQYPTSFIAGVNRPARDEDQGWIQRQCQQATNEWELAFGSASAYCLSSAPNLVCPDSYQLAIDNIYKACGGTSDLGEEWDETAGPIIKTIAEDCGCSWATWPKPQQLFSYIGCLLLICTQF